MKETDREIRNRIEALKLALVEGAPERRPRRRAGTGTGTGPATGPAGSHVSVNTLDGAREIASELGPCLILERDIADCFVASDLEAAVGELTGSDAGCKYIFLDLETTGFSSTPLFLAGTMFERGGGLACTQLLARDYSEERALVGMLDSLISGFDLCITFNGKSFDMPYLRERAKYHRLDLRSDPAQLDLLHHARRLWRDSLPNCRLATLERHVLGRLRSGDIRGWEVPCIYHEFVHTGDARRLVGVIRHNLLDVVSMAELLICLAKG